MVKMKTISIIDQQHRLRLTALRANMEAAEVVNMLGEARIENGMMLIHRCSETTLLGCKCMMQKV